MVLQGLNQSPINFFLSGFEYNDIIFCPEPILINVWPDDCKLHLIKNLWQLFCNILNFIYFCAQKYGIWITN